MITIGAVVRLPPGYAHTGEVGVVVEIRENGIASVVGPYGSLRATWSHSVDPDILTTVTSDEQTPHLLAMAVDDRNAAIRLCHDYAQTAANAQARCVALEQALTGAATRLLTIKAGMSDALGNVIKNLVHDAEVP